MGRRNKNIAKGENTVIGAGTVINGGIVADSMVMRIDGTINGNVKTDGDLIVGEKGKIEGNVDASSLVLAGVVNGNVNSTNKITIEAGGRLIGNIDTALLAMDETAILQGMVNMRIEKTDADKEEVEEKKENCGAEEIEHE